MPGVHSPWGHKESNTTKGLNWLKMRMIAILISPAFLQRLNKIDVSIGPRTQKAFDKHSLLLFSLQKHCLYYFPSFFFFSVINSVLNNVPQLSSCSFATWGPFTGLACSPPAFLCSLESGPPWFLSGPPVSWALHPPLWHAWALIYAIPANLPSVTDPHPEFICICPGPVGMICFLIWGQDEGKWAHLSAKRFDFKS